MSKTLVINLTGITQHVGVVHSGGTKDDVQIMPRKRVELRVGMTVDPAWLGRNPNCVKVVNPTVISPTVVASRRQPTPSGEVTRTIADLQPAGTPADAVTVADIEAKAAVDTPTEGEGK